MYFLLFFFFLVTRTYACVSVIHLHKPTLTATYYALSYEWAGNTAHSFLNNSISSVNIWWMSKWLNECMSGSLLKWHFLSFSNFGLIREQCFRKLKFQCGCSSWWYSHGERQGCQGGCRDPKQVLLPFLKKKKKNLTVHALWPWFVWMVTSNRKRDDNKHSVMNIWSVLLGFATLNNDGFCGKELLLSQIHGVKWESEGDTVTK